jgi:hypothetical protein
MSRQNSAAPRSIRQAADQADVTEDKLRSEGIAGQHANHTPGLKLVKRVGSFMHTEPHKVTSPSSVNSRDKSSHMSVVKGLRRQSTAGSDSDGTDYNSDYELPGLGRSSDLDFVEECPVVF